MGGSKLWTPGTFLAKLEATRFYSPMYVGAGDLFLEPCASSYQGLAFKQVLPPILSHQPPQKMG